MLLFLIKLFLATVQYDDFGWSLDLDSKCKLLNQISKDNEKLKIDCYQSNRQQLYISKYIDKISNDYIITLDDLTKNKDHMITNLNKVKYAKVNNIYSHSISGFSATLSQTALLDILKNKDVVTVEKDEVAYSQIYQTMPTWNLDRIDQPNNKLNQIYNTGSFNGEGIDIFIVDTGINPNHVEFTSRIGNGISFINDRYGWTDCNGHGTHVAGIAGGTRFGVAKKSILHSVRVLNCYGSGTWSNIISGIDWIVSERQRLNKPVIASISIGGSKSLAINNAVNMASKQGVFVVVAAGNEVSDACNYSPSSASRAITVGGINIDDKTSYFSNFGDCVNIYAPANNIKSASHIDNTGYRFLSGTSMACPHVSGVIALYLSRCSGDEILNHLYKKSTNLLWFEL
jgi:subtilisin family serine protease